MLEELKKLQVGMPVYWKEYKRPFRVQARSARYIVVSRTVPRQYSILDLETGRCAPAQPNVKLTLYGGFWTKEACEQALVDLESGNMLLSERNQWNITEVVDLARTIEKLPN